MSDNKDIFFRYAVFCKPDKMCTVHDASCSLTELASVTVAVHVREHAVYDVALSVCTDDHFEKSRGRELALTRLNEGIKIISLCQSDIDACSGIINVILMRLKGLEQRPDWLPMKIWRQISDVKLMQRQQYFRKFHYVSL